MLMPVSGTASNLNPSSKRVVAFQKTPVPVYASMNAVAVASDVVTIDAARPEVSVFDEQNEDGVEEGLIAEYTIEKFGVPYKVTIECSASAKEQCRDTGQIAKDSELLKLVRANPPPQ